MSKRSERIAKAKARTPEETAALRKGEREKPTSGAARFIAGPNAGRTLEDVAKSQ